jgi:hypothetical protein
LMLYLHLCMHNPSRKRKEAKQNILIYKVGKKEMIMLPLQFVL